MIQHMRLLFWFPGNPEETSCEYGNHRVSTFIDGDTVSWKPISRSILKANGILKFIDFKW